MYYYMTKLAFICNWHTDFGYFNYEREYIEYFKKKKFVLYICDVNDCEIEWFKDYCIDNLNNILTPFIVKDYIFNGRIFCNLNYSFYNFIKKCKEYYKNKIANYKHPNNILYRQRFGKFYMI